MAQSCDHCAAAGPLPALAGVAPLQDAGLRARASTVAAALAHLADHGSIWRDPMPQAVDDLSKATSPGDFLWLKA